MFTRNDRLADTPTIEPGRGYATRCLATLDAIRGAVLAGPTAAAWWQLPLMDMPSHITIRGVARGRWAAGIRVLDGEAEHVDLRGVRVTTVAWTVIDCARVLSRRDGLIVADAALNRGMCSPAELRQVADRVRGRTGAAAARWVVDNADPGADSPGETWLRLMVRDLGYDPVSQFHVSGEGVDAYVDLMLDGRLGLEFDGMVKYRGAASVMQEKVRQAGIESLGIRLLRVVWPQLSDPEGLDRRIQANGVPRVRKRRAGR